jgi:predicted PurR-regulated permease PerM
LSTKVNLDQGTILSLERAFGDMFSIKALFENLTAYISNQLGMIARFFSFTAITLFLAFLFIPEMPASISRSFRSLSAVSQREFGILLDKLSDVWNGWLRSTVITSVIIGLTTGIELFLFGIPYAGLIGVITGFLNLIPTFGALISYLLVIVVTYTHTFP